jgi:hypothetical protein
MTRTDQRGRADAIRLPVERSQGREMNRRSGILLLILVILCSITAGVWYYQSKCRGIDACAAAEAESHEREKPDEPR